MDSLFSSKVKNIFLAAVDESHALTGLFVVVFKLFYNDRDANTFEYFQQYAKELVPVAGSKYASGKVAQLIQAIEENFSQSEERDELCIAYRNLYVDIFNNAWHFHTKTARMKHLREYFEAELEGWV